MFFSIAPNAVNPGTWSGMVRVVYNSEPGIDRRALIKGMKGEVHIEIIIFNWLAIWPNG
jgi:hypothetical protein